MLLQLDRSSAATSRLFATSSESASWTSTPPASMYSATSLVSGFSYGVTIAIRRAPSARSPSSSAPAEETTGTSAPSPRSTSRIWSSAVQWKPGPGHQRDEAGGGDDVAARVGQLGGRAAGLLVHRAQLLRGDPAHAHAAGVEGEALVGRLGLPRAQQRGDLRLHRDVGARDDQPEAIAACSRVGDRVDPLSVPAAWRAYAARAPAAAISAAAPPSARPARGLATSASQPTSGAPIGVEPRKTTDRATSRAPHRRRGGELERRVDAGGERHGDRAERHEREDLERQRGRRGGEQLEHPEGGRRADDQPRGDLLAGRRSAARRRPSRRPSPSSSPRRSSPCRATSSGPAAASGPGS